MRALKFETAITVREQWFPWKQMPEEISIQRDILRLGVLHSRYSCVATRL